MSFFFGDRKNYNIEQRAFCSMRRQAHQLYQSGFSLIELIIVIAIMGIVMAISTISFNSWQTKSRIESQTREIYADLADARTKAFTQKKVHGIVFQPNSYVMKSYSSEVEYASITGAAANGVVISSKSLKYGITKTDTATAFTDLSVLFDITGLTSTTPSTSTFGFTIVVNPVNISPAINCLVISVARVNMGKWNATTSKCEFK